MVNGISGHWASLYLCGHVRSLGGTVLTRGGRLCALCISSITCAALPVHVLGDSLVEPPEVAGRHLLLHALLGQSRGPQDRLGLLHLALPVERIGEGFDNGLITMDNLSDENMCGVGPPAEGK